jgi:acyl dehydratase
MDETMRLFDSVQIGDELPPLVRGPMSPLHLMRFSAAIENWHRIHYDEKFAIEHDGLPGILVSGSWKQHFVGQMVRRWVGRHGWMATIELRFRIPNPAREILTAWGQVTGLDKMEGFGLVHCDVGIRNGDGVESSPGTATCVLPLDASHPVPYPFPGLASLTEVRQ